MKNINKLLDVLVQKNGSDLHISSGEEPLFRIKGDIERIESMPNISHERAQKILYSIMTEEQKKKFEEYWETDFAYEASSIGRFRVNIFTQFRGISGVFRYIPSQIKTLDEIDAPPILKKICMKKNGLILITGPTGSGKSTTLSAMLNHINENCTAHILTIEDPIEFVHENKKSLVSQREIITHTHSFQIALRSALREDPDVILVGELRDLETIRLALTAAETGHLVMATLHTVSAAKTIDRIIDIFPNQEKEIVRTIISESLRAVVSQRLIKTKDSTSLIPVQEILIGTYAVKNMIRENKVSQIEGAMQTGTQYGMQTMQQRAEYLIKEGIISKDQIKHFSQNNNHD